MSRPDLLFSKITPRGEWLLREREFARPIGRSGAGCRRIDPYRRFDPLLPLMSDRIGEYIAPLLLSI
jgi:hypothetical protein